MHRVGRRVRVTGRVQGVFFRAWTRQHAHALGVTGWARNCADGSVEAHLAGEEGAVAQLIARLHDGPPSAIVTNVQVEDAEPEPGDCFEVRH
jgi:acylphosphatase